MRYVRHGAGTARGAGTDLHDVGQRLEQLARETRLVLHERAHELGDLDEHPVVGRARQQREEVGGEAEVVGGLLARELADDVDGAADDRRRLVRQAALQVVEGEAQALRVLEVQLVQEQRRLLADVRARGREHRDDVGEQVAREVLRGDVGEEVDADANLVRRARGELLLEQRRAQHEHVRRGRERLRGGEEAHALEGEALLRHDLDDREGRPGHVVPEHVQLRAREKRETWRSEGGGGAAAVGAWRPKLPPTARASA